MSDGESSTCHTTMGEVALAMASVGAAGDWADAAEAAVMTLMVARSRPGNLNCMFDFFKKKPRETINMAAEYTNTPLSNQMVMLFAEELPMLDSMERAKVYRALEVYEGPQITSQEMLPVEIRRIMDI